MHFGVLLQWNVGVNGGMGKAGCIAELRYPVGGNGVSVNLRKRIV